MAKPFAIPLSRPHLPPRTADLVRDVLATGRLGGAGSQTAWCEDFLERSMGVARVLLTNSASSALDAACLLLNLKRGDEVVMPSFAFPTAASAIARLGAIPVFADIEGGRLGLDPARAEEALTSRTRAILVVHYAGIAADLVRLSRLAEEHDLQLIEDASQAFDSHVGGRAIGTFGTIGVVSFQQTKNIAVGEGGALVINDPALTPRAQHIRDKGTNRREMELGKAPFYEWVEIGSGIAPNELTAALLRAQLEVADEIKAARRRLFDRYAIRLASLAASGGCTLVDATSTPDHNAHSFFLLLPDRSTREMLRVALNEKGIGAATHFEPLHSSPAGRRFGRAPDSCPITTSIAARILRLPLYVDLGENNLDMICDTIIATMTRRA
jgi:dTDP-4-amino-4,6-dideoxygalactose transaminase